MEEDFRVPRACKDLWAAYDKSTTLRLAPLIPFH
jgi:hypothetical protein